MNHYERVRDKIRDCHLNLLLWGPNGWDDKLEAEWQAAVTHDVPTLVIAHSGATPPETLLDHPLVVRHERLPEGVEPADVEDDLRALILETIDRLHGGES